jgi:hypothetical protein
LKYDFKDPSRSQSQSQSPSPIQNTQNILDDWFCDTQEANPVTNQITENLFANWDDDELVGNNAFFQNSAEAKKPALVSQVCFCIVFSCVLVFVS